MANNELNDLLVSLEKRKEPATISENTKLRKIEENSLITMGDAKLDNANIIDRFRASSLRSKKELEAAKLIFDTNITLLAHQSDAKVRESKAFWDAKSVEVAEKIKTYVQSNIRELEIERLTSRNDAIEEAYNRANDKMQEVIKKDLPDNLKVKLIAQLVDNLEDTVERIRNDVIAEKYNLK